ncbi:hypothetical protein D9M68_834730 [compost metagenome]
MHDGNDLLHAGLAVHRVAFGDPDVRAVALRRDALHGPFGACLDLRSSGGPAGWIGRRLGREAGRRRICGLAGSHARHVGGQGQAHHHFVAAFQASGEGNAG